MKDENDRSCSRNEKAPCKSPPPNRSKPVDKEEGLRLWGILIFGIILVLLLLLLLKRAQGTLHFFACNTTIDLKFITNVDEYHIDERFSNFLYTFCLQYKGEWRDDRERMLKLLKQRH